MNQQLKTFLIILGTIFIAGGSLLYGALTAPKSTTNPAPTQVQAATTKTSGTVESQLSTIATVLESAYPKATTDYTMIKPQLYEQGEWFGALLQYKGSDTANRDTLRVLMQKKNSIWVLRTTPPEMLLSVKKYDDVPKSVLKAINNPVGLP